MPFMPNLPTIIFGFSDGFRSYLDLVLSVVSKIHDKETAALFGLFYTLMNVGYAIGGRIFDGMRAAFGEHGVYSISEKFGISLPFDITLSTYQMIILLGFAINVPDLIAILMFRDGVELHDDGKMTITPVSVMSKAGTSKCWGEQWRKPLLKHGRTLQMFLRKKLSGSLSGCFFSLFSRGLYLNISTILSRNTEYGFSVKGRG